MTADAVRRVTLPGRFVVFLPTVSHVGVSRKIESREERARLVDFLGLERNIVAVSIAMFLMGLGEELWKRFLPKYMQALGAPVIAIAAWNKSDS